MAHAQEIFVHDGQARFGQQEMHVRHPPVQAVFDRDDRPFRLSVAHGIDRILECETGQRHAIGRIAKRRQMRIGPRRALIGNGAGRVGGGFFSQLRDNRARGGGIVFHGWLRA